MLVHIIIKLFALLLSLTPHKPCTQESGRYRLQLIVSSLYALVALFYALLCRGGRVSGMLEVLLPLMSGTFYCIFPAENTNLFIIMMYDFNLFDPLSQSSNPYPYNFLPPGQAKDSHPDGAAPQDQQSDALTSAAVGCVFQVAALFLLLLLLALLSSCSTPKESSSSVERHSMETLTERMDSLMHSRTVVQQDSVWRESVMRQFESIREKSDTSHYVVADSLGNIIRERIVINNTREVTSERERHEREVLMHRLEVMDSTVRAQSFQLTRMDSLLRQDRETVEREVEKPLSWWQQSQIWLGRLVLVALAVLLVSWLWRNRTWWLSLLRRLF